MAPIVKKTYSKSSGQTSSSCSSIYESEKENVSTSTRANLRTKKKQEEFLGQLEKSRSNAFDALLTSPL